MLLEALAPADESFCARFVLVNRSQVLWGRTLCETPYHRLNPFGNLGQWQESRKTWKICLVRYACSRLECLPCITLSGTTLSNTIFSLALIIRIVIEVDWLITFWLAISPELRKLLTVLEKNLDEIVEHGLVAIVDEGSGETLVANTSSAA